MELPESIEVIMRIYFSAMKAGFGSYGTEIIAHAEKVQGLVRCEECEYRNGDCCHCNHGFAHGGNTFFVHSDDFCKYGERKSDDD